MPRCKKTCLFATNVLPLFTSSSITLPLHSGNPQQERPYVLKTFVLIVLTDGVALNSIVGWDNGCFQVVDAYCARCPMLKHVSSIETKHGRNCYPWLDRNVICTRVSPVWSFVSITWKYARTILCILQFIVENVVRNTKRNVWLSGDINQLNAPVHFKKGIYKPHCVYRRGHASASVSLLVVNMSCS
jgi:hypothetical protein